LHNFFHVVFGPAKRLRRVTSITTGFSTALLAHSKASFQQQLGEGKDTTI
jgi:hypothetical protein